MSIFKQLRSSMKSPKQEFEKPKTLTIEELESLNATEIKNTFLRMDAYSGQILKTNKDLVGLNSDYAAKTEELNAQVQHLLAVNKQINQHKVPANLNQTALNVLRESLLLVLSDGTDQLEFLREFLKKSLAKGKKVNKTDQKEQMKSEVKEILNEDSEQGKGEESKTEGIEREQSGEDQNIEEVQESIQVPKVEETQNLAEVAQAFTKLALVVDKLYLGTLKCSLFGHIR